MNTNSNTLIRQFENLIAEASKSNTEVIGEITKFISGWDRSKMNSNFIVNMQKKIFSDAVQRILALNLNYAKELMNIGVELSKKLNEPSQDNIQDKVYNKLNVKNSISAFELKASALPGSEAHVAFLLNSDKNEPIICNIQNELYHMDTDPASVLDFKTNYEPQLFELKKGISQRVDTTIYIPSKTKSGTYKSKITVAGFEHTHFNLTVQVLESPQEEIVKAIVQKKNPIERKHNLKAKTNPKPVNTKKSAPRNRIKK